MAVRAATRVDPATRARVLRAAAELFAERGFHGTTVRDIATRAGANVAAGHYHFGSKRDLYIEVLRATFAEVRGVLARGGVQPSAAALDRMSRSKLEALLAKRVRLVLENLHGALMQREMLDPSDALPIVVAEFIAPMMEDAAAVVRRLAPGLDDEALRWCVMSIMGQSIFYRFTMPASLSVLGLRTFSAAYARRLAAHIAAFSIGGLARVAPLRRRARAR
jgi:AcrR family transcriptional regulator